MRPSAAALRTRGFAGLRVVGDVHGDSRGLAAGLEGARAGRLFVIQLGDLVDEGPDPAGALRLMLDALDRGEALFLLGNHEAKLRRSLQGRVPGGTDRGPADTLAAIAACPDAEALRARAARAIAEAPAWLRIGPLLFVHGAFHRAMLHEPAPTGALAARPSGPLARALYGQVTGPPRADGYPERSLAWVDEIPEGLTVFCGHDRRSTDGRPWRRRGRQGGEAVFLDTGAGKGGHLSWIDLPLEAAAGLQASG